MRPIRLSLTAFGPFAGTEVVDFSRIEKQLLLIEGPTGAGKTTLLDGICYALFGTVPGPRLEAVTQLRSHHTRGSEACSAELTFALGPRTFRVVREPSQKRPKRRGEGQAEARAVARLLEITADGEKPVCAPKVTEVDRAVRELLGLDADQFMQVLLLPQGEFRRFLLSRSDEKEKLLEKLFGTLLYRDAADRLTLRRSALHKSAEEAGSLRDEALAAAGGLALPDLRERVLELEGQVGVRATAAARAREEMHAALARFEAARSAALALENRDALRREWADLEKERPSLAVARHRLEQSARASSLAGLLARETETRRAAGETGQELERRRATQALALEDLRLRKEAASTAPALRVRADALAAEESAARELVAVETKEKERRLALAGALREAGAAREERDRLGRERDAALTARHDRAEKLAALRQRGAQVGELDLVASQAKGVVERREALEIARTAGTRARSEEAAAQAAAERAREVARAREQALHEARTAREEGVAAELAGTLVPGEPCPVCGSADHPTPATAEGTTPSRTQLAALEKALAEARAIAEQADRRIPVTSAEVARCQALVDRETIELGEKAREPLEDLKTRARATALEARAAHAATLEAQRLAATLGADDELLAQAAGKLDAAAERTLVAEREADRLRVLHGEVRETLAARLPPGFTAVELAEKIRAELQKIRAEAQSLEGALARSEKQDAAARAAVDGALESARRAAEEADRASQEMVRAAAGAGFASTRDAAEALLPEETAAELAALVRDFSGRETSTNDRLREAEAAAAGVTPVDQAEAAASAERARNSAFEAERAGAEAGKDLAGSRAALERAEGHEATYALALAELTVVGSLAAVLRGENPLRLTLQRFVLASRMDEVAVAASARLLQMSRGRYLLRRTDEVSHGGRASGLDLVVEDRSTGSERSVHTLSGGEMFLASLALALGLSDVVTRRSGGVRLDALFIDEGFGMLDDESLDLVLGTLEDLQAGGRLVGLISHLAELKERIPVRLTVHKGPRGSRTEIRAA